MSYLSGIGRSACPTRRTDAFVSSRLWGRLAICGRLAIGQASAARPLG